MKVCVFGLWHLGCVTAACLAELGISVIGLDFDETVINGLRNSIAPIHEPGLNELINKNLNTFISFTTDPALALKETDYLWVTFDTPVDNEDNADTQYVINTTENLFNYFKMGLKIIISSQLLVGSTNKLRIEYNKHYEKSNVSFCYSPENLRLGKAIDIFMNPDRIVIGADDIDRDKYECLFSKISRRLEWMSIESAEMTKHSINAFLAVSAVFANEIATICEFVGADAKEVERGLKTEQRIGNKAYVAPSSAISGGTLKRDIMFLGNLANKYNFQAPLIKSIGISNDLHKMWAKNKALQILGSLSGKNIGILGLTYKPGTDTLRRSLSVELCKELFLSDAVICAYDPLVKKLDEEYCDFINLTSNITQVFNNADCVILCTEWNDFKNCLNQQNINIMRNKIIIDCNGFMFEEATKYEDCLNYVSFGRKHN
jgi:UDPglucose 6-dehydrogenase